MVRTKDEEPVQQSVHVDCPVEEAFELFTARFDEWWPEPGVRELGAVTIWDPPRRVQFGRRHAGDDSIAAR